MKTTILILLLYVTFNLFSQANAGKNQLVCQGSFIKILGKGLNTNDTGFYTWTDLSINTIVSTKDSLYLKSNNVGIKFFELKVEKIINSQSSFSFDTVEVETVEIPIFNGFNIPSHCFNDGAINLSNGSGISASVGKNHSNLIPSDSLIFYENKSPSWILGGPVGIDPYILDYEKFINMYTVPSVGLSVQPCVKYTDLNGCTNFQCKTFKLIPNPTVILKALTFCQKTGLIDLEKLIVVPINRIGGTETFRCLDVPAGSGVDKDSIIWIDNSIYPSKHVLDPGQECEKEKAGEYKIEYCYRNAFSSCNTCDTINITVIHSPKLELKQIPKICEKSSFILNSFIYNDCTKTKFNVTKWSVSYYNNSNNTTDSIVNLALSKSIDSNLFTAQKGLKGTYKLNVNIDNSECGNFDNITLEVIESPVVKFDLPEKICSNEKSFQLINIEPQGNVGSWSGKGVFLDSFSPSAVSNFNTHIENIDISYCYTAANNCSETLIKSIQVVKKPEIKIDAQVLYNGKYAVKLGTKNQNINNEFMDFSWNINNQTLTDSIIEEYVYNDGGEKKISLTTKNKAFSCFGNDSTLIKFGNLSLLNSENSLIKIFPNPFNNIINFENINGINFQFELFDNNGKLIIKMDINETKSLDLSFLNKGFYFCKITKNESVYISKLNKE